MSYLMPKHQIHQQEQRGKKETAPLIKMLIIIELHHTLG